MSMSTLAGEGWPASLGVVFLGFRGVSGDGSWALVDSTRGVVRSCELVRGRGRNQSSVASSKESGSSEGGWTRTSVVRIETGDGE